jgi:hypothetical protein
MTILPRDTKQKNGASLEVPGANKRWPTRLEDLVVFNTADGRQKGIPQDAVERVEPLLIEDIKKNETGTTANFSGEPVLLAMFPGTSLAAGQRHRLLALILKSGTHKCALIIDSVIETKLHCPIIEETGEPGQFLGTSHVYGRDINVLNPEYWIEKAIAD